MFPGTGKTYSYFVCDQLQVLSVYHRKFGFDGVKVWYFGDIKLGWVTAYKPGMITPNSDLKNYCNRLIKF